MGLRDEPQGPEEERHEQTGASIPLHMKNTGATWCHVVPHGAAWCRVVPCGTAWCRMRILSLIFWLRHCDRGTPLLYLLYTFCFIGVTLHTLATGNTQSTLRFGLGDDEYEPREGCTRGIKLMLIA